MPSNHERDMLRLLKEVNDLKAELRSLQRIFPRNLRGSDFIARRSGFEFERRIVREVPEGGNADQHLEAVGDGTYTWADTREVPDSQAQDFYLVDEGDGTYAFRQGVMNAATFRVDPTFTDPINGSTGAFPLEQILTTDSEWVSLTPPTQIHIDHDGFIVFTGIFTVTTTSNNQEAEVYGLINGTNETPRQILAASSNANETDSTAIFSGAQMSAGDFIEIYHAPRRGTDLNLIPEGTFLEVRFYRLGAFNIGVGV